MLDFFFDYLECDEWDEWKNARRYAKCLALKTASMLREIAEMLEEHPDSIFQAESDLKQLLSDLSPHLTALDAMEYEG